MEKEGYRFLKDLQFKHWWFNGRRKVVEAFIGSDRNETKGQVLDIGSGYGALVSVLKTIGCVDVIEPYKEAHQTLIDIGVQNIFDIIDFPYSYPSKKYDYVTLFDVLEHIEDDTRALEVIKEKLLKLGGKCIITVPAYMWLWTKHDDINHHFRRYNKAGLKKIMEHSGFKNIRISYFMTFLFPLAVLERIFLKIRPNKNADLKLPNPIVNKLFEVIFGLEDKFISKIDFPFGLSLIARGEV